MEESERISHKLGFIHRYTVMEFNFVYLRENLKILPRVRNLQNLKTNSQRKWLR